VSQPKLTDDDLLERWRAGELGAGSALLSRHWMTLRRFFMYRISQDYVDDLVQETLSQVVASPGNYRGVGVFRSYLLGIARRVLMHHYRSRNRSPERSSEPLGFHDLISTFDLEERASDGQAYARLHEALAKLPEPMHEIVVGKYFQGLSVRELATMFGMNEQTIKSTLFRGRSKLSKLLVEE